MEREVVNPATLEGWEDEPIQLEQYDEHQIAAPCPFCQFLALGDCEHHAMDRLTSHLNLAHKVGHA